VNYDELQAPDTAIVGEGQRLGAESLEVFFARTPRFAVAYSGGCDSSFLLAAAQEAGCVVHAYTVDTAFQAPFEKADAEEVVCALGVPHTIIPVDILSAEEVVANPANRCQLCKAHVFAAIKQAALADGFTVVADGTNASDNPARRPGFISLAEAGVVSPLRRAGYTKARVRSELARLERVGEYAPGSLMSSKPSFPCLAVFVETGTPLTWENLQAVAEKHAVERARAAQAQGL
jgi:uncharacterized protein